MAQAAVQMAEKDHEPMSQDKTMTAEECVARNKAMAKNEENMMRVLLGNEKLLSQFFRKTLKDAKMSSVQHFEENSTVTTGVVFKPHATAVPAIISDEWTKLLSCTDVLFCKQNGTLARYPVHIAVLSEGALNVLAQHNKKMQEQADSINSNRQLRVERQLQKERLRFIQDLAPEDDDVEEGEAAGSSGDEDDDEPCDESQAASNLLEVQKYFKDLAPGVVMVNTPDCAHPDSKKRKLAKE